MPRVRFSWVRRRASPFSRLPAWTMRGGRRGGGGAGGWGGGRPRPERASGCSVTVDQLLWLTSRAAALTAFFVLAAALVTGQALRSAMFEGAMRNRDLSNLHRFLTVCWVPFVGLHVLAMTLDAVARISPIDLVIPFRVSYAPFAIGFGTIGFDLLLVVAVRSSLQRPLDPLAWAWLPRL